MQLVPQNDLSILNHMDRSILNGFHVPSVKKKVVTKRAVKQTIDPSTQSSIMTLPYTEGSFRFIKCSRRKANGLQKWLYSVNKNNAGGRVYATRYNYKEGGLMVWRMS